MNFYFKFLWGKCSILWESPLNIIVLGRACALGGIVELRSNRELQPFKVGWPKNHVTIKPLQMNVLFLTTLPTCNSPYMQLYFKRFFVLHSSEVIFSFLIKTSM